MIKISGARVPSHRDVIENEKFIDNADQSSYSWSCDSRCIVLLDIFHPQQATLLLLVTLDPASLFTFILSLALIFVLIPYLVVAVTMTSLIICAYLGSVFTSVLV